MRTQAALAALALAGSLLVAPSAEASLFGGVGKIISGVLQVPVSALSGTVNGPPVLGTVLGAIGGVASGVGQVTQGVLECLSAAAASAKRAAPLLVPVLLSAR